MSEGGGWRSEVGGRRAVDGIRICFFSASLPTGRQVCGKIFFKHKGHKACLLAGRFALKIEASCRHALGNLFALGRRAPEALFGNFPISLLFSPVNLRDVNPCNNQEHPRQLLHSKMLCKKEK